MSYRPWTIACSAFSLWQVFYPLFTRSAATGENKNARLHRIGVHRGAPWPRSGSSYRRAQGCLTQLILGQLGGRHTSQRLKGRFINTRLDQIVADELCLEADPRSHRGGQLSRHGRANGQNVPPCTHCEGISIYDLACLPESDC